MAKFSTKNRPSKSVRPKSGRVTKKFAAIPARQLNLPAGFSGDGKKMVPLRDVLSPEVPTRDFAELSPPQQAQLTAERIRRQRRFKIGMVGAGVIDKKRAIAEVKANTHVGRTLVEIEQRTIRMLKEKAGG